MNSDQILKYIETLNADESSFARKSVDFYDSKQLTHMADRLSNQNTGRANWKERGFNLHFRNLTKMITDKSSMLFVNGMPNYEVWTSDSVVDDKQTETFLEYVEDTDFMEFLINLDPIVRLLKTVVVLTQYDSEQDKFSYELLHKGNSIFVKKPGEDTLGLVIHKTASIGDESTYRVWTDTTIEDWSHKSSKSAKPELISQVENPYGFVPATLYHDTNVPRVGTANVIQRDLVGFNEEYNLFLIDMLWAAAYSLRKTLYTNMGFGEEDFESAAQVTSGSRSKFPTYGGATDQVISGPDRTVFVDSTGVESPYLEYKGPEIELEKINDMFHGFAKDVAFDWSVRIRVDGYGNATSGFQLVVEEIPNLELRKIRARMAEQGIQRVFDSMKDILAAVRPNSGFSEDAELFVTFAKPSMPTDPQKDDELWFNRIEKGLADKVDYFINVYNMSEEEAQAKVISLSAPTEIQPINNE